jgi:magnesium-transporting ATPase (P-type)
MVTAVTLALALSFEAGERDVMHRPPRRPDAPILSPFMLWRIGFVSAILVAAVLGLFLWARDAGAPIAEARTLAVNALVAGEIAYLFSVRMLNGPALSRHALATARPAAIAVALVAALQALFTYWGPMQTLFDTAPLDSGHWLEIGAVALAVLAVVEAEKALLRRLRPRRGAPEAV